MAIYRVTFQTEMLIDCENETEAEKIGYDNLENDIRNGIVDIVSMKRIETTSQLRRDEHNSLPWRANSRNWAHEPEKNCKGNFGEQIMMYDKEQYKKWNRLDDYLKNPVNFPSNIVSNFLVVFDAPDGFKDKYPFKSGEQVLFLGEIPGMRGHGIFSPYNGSIVWGYHLDGFYVIPKEEL